MNVHVKWRIPKEKVKFKDFYVVTQIKYKKNIQLMKGIFWKLKFPKISFIDFN